MGAAFSGKGLFSPLPGAVGLRLASEGQEEGSEGAWQEVQPCLLEQEGAPILITDSDALHSAVTPAGLLPGLSKLRPSMSRAPSWWWQMR